MIFLFRPSASLLSALLGLTFCLTAPTMMSGATTALVVSGGPEEPITRGASYYYLPENGTFTLYEQGENGFRVVFQGPSIQERWDLFFSAPSGQPLTVGTYDNATRGGGDTGGLDVSGFGIGCDHSSGLFVVHELVRELDGALVSFHISFRTSCYGAYPPLVGEILYNSSDPLPAKTRITNELTAVATKGQPFKFQLTSSAQLPTYSATGLPPGITLDFSSGLLFGTPTAEGVFLVAFTVLDNTNNTSASATLQITVAPANQSIGPYTAISILADPGEFITGGIDKYVGSNDAYFFSFVGLDGGTLISSNQWSVSLFAPSGQQLVPGQTYVHSTPNAVPDEAYLTLSGPIRGGSITSTGSFEVLEIGDDRIHARFEYHYENQQPAVRGTVWRRALNAITSSPQIRVTSGKPLTYQIIANNAPKSFAAENLPPGLTLDPATGIISGTTSVGGRQMVDISAVGETSTATDKISIYVTSPGPSPPAATPVISLSVNTTQVHEGDVARFTVSSSAPSAFNLTPRFQVTRKKASPGDYTLSPVALTIPAGQTSASMDLHAMVDTLTEKPESVSIKLTKGPGYKVGPNSKATVTILDGP